MTSQQQLFALKGIIFLHSPAPGSLEANVYFCYNVIGKIMLIVKGGGSWQLKEGLNSSIA